MSGEIMPPRSKNKQEETHSRKQTSLSKLESSDGMGIARNQALI
jgi:hypothetical protein